jgi:hypothetical protein
MWHGILAAIIPAAVGIVTVAVAGVRSQLSRPKGSSEHNIDPIRRA